MKGFLADLTGASDRWIRTLLYQVVIGRLSIFVVYALLLLVTPEMTQEGFSGVVRSLDTVMVIAALVFAPLVESLILLMIVGLVGGKFGAPRWFTVLFAGAAFLPMHGLVLMSLVIVPFFILMALVQFNWMKRSRTWAGYGIVVLIHALQNLFGLTYAAAFGIPA